MGFPTATGFWKGISIFLTYIWHHATGRIAKGIILGILLFLFIPDIDNILVMTSISILWGIPLLTVFLVWEAIGIILIFIVWRYF